MSEGNWVAFPNLGLYFEVEPVAFSIGSFDVKWQWIFAVAAAILFIYLYIDSSERRGMEKKTMYSSLAVGGFFGLLGARALAALMFDLLHWYTLAEAGRETALFFYTKNFLKYFFDITDELMLLYGGLMLGAAGLVAFCGIANGAVRKKQSRGTPAPKALKGERPAKYRFADMADCFALALPLSQSVLSFGNIFSQTGFGGHSDSIFAMSGSIVTESITALHREWIANGGAAVGAGTRWKFDVNGNALPVSANFLLQIFFCVLIYILLRAVIAKKATFRGEIALWYLLTYSVVRVFMEADLAEYTAFYRMNINLVIALITIVLSAILLLIFKWRVKEGGMKKISIYVDKNKNDGFENTEFWQREYKAEDIIDELIADKDNKGESKALAEPEERNGENGKEE